MRALALNVPVVTEAWLYRSLESGDWIDPRVDIESPDLFNGTDACDVNMLHPRFGKRLTNDSSLLYQPVDFMKTKKIYLDLSASNKKAPPQSFFTDIIRLCGGTVVSNVFDADIAIIGDTVVILLYTYLTGTFTFQQAVEMTILLKDSRRK